MTGKLLGAVLAGGASRRFGSPKALAKLHGRPLWRLAVDRLEPLCARVVVVGADPAAFPGLAGLADEAAAPRARDRVEAAPDRTPGAGPLGGVEAALALAAQVGLDGALALAVDMPWAPEAALRRLAEEFAVGVAGEVRLRAPRSGPPWGFEPLCAAYPVGVLPRLEAALAAGVRQAGAFARSQRPALVECGVPREAFRSVNAPGDLPPPTVSVVGNKNSGKTTLAVALIDELAKRGRRVMSAKHGHRFRLDAPGTDSWRHRHEGGAERVLLAGPREFALVGEWSPDRDEGARRAGSPRARPAPPSLDLLLTRHLAGAEIVVAEGFRNADAPKIQIHRSGAQPEPAFPPEEARSAGVLAVVTDRPDLPWRLPVFDPDAPKSVPSLADLVEKVLL